MSILSEISQTEYERQRLKFGKEILENWRRIMSARSLEYAKCGYFTLFVIFCKQRQRNEQRIITHAYTALVLVAVAVKIKG